MDVILKRDVQIAVKFLRASCGVRYWEDADVDGVSDEDGSLIPCRDGDNWTPLIELETGIIQNWEAGKTADVHYKVCDDGAYALLSENMAVIKQIEGYVPTIMCPEENGYGDYVIMKVGAGGKIANWKPDLSAFAAST